MCLFVTMDMSSTLYVTNKTAVSGSCTKEREVTSIASAGKVIASVFWETKEITRENNTWRIPCISS